MIYFPGTYVQTDSHFREFLPIIEPHLQRCSFFALWLDLDFVDEVPFLSLPRLSSLKIFIGESAADDIPPVKNIKIPEETLENTRDIDLGGQVPVDWARTLGHLRGLRTLTLDEVSDNTTDQEQIFSVLLASPGIEALVINGVEIEDRRSNISPSTELISLPKLRSVTLMNSGLLTNNVLRRIRPPPEMAKLEIDQMNIPSHLATSFWEETMAPWVPHVQQLYQNSSKRLVALHPGRGIVDGCCCSVDSGVISAVDGGPGGLRLYVEHPAVEENDILAVLQRMRGLTEIWVKQLYCLSRPPVDALLNMLGEPTADSIGTPDPRPTFPDLQKLGLQDWMWELDDFMDMVQRRYSMRSTAGQQFPDLTLDISPLHRWYTPEIKKKIISFWTAKALRDLDGVKK
ncbi:hypothetical protein FRC01_004135, partial [Tulasnella sp. 417]